jgi:hypothetical protein
MSEAAAKNIPFTPKFPSRTLDSHFRKIVENSLAGVRAQSGEEELPVVLEKKRKEIIRAYERKAPKDLLHLLSAVNVLIDLLKQGWELEVRSDGISLQRPCHYLDAEQGRDKIREQHHAARSEQLTTPSVRSFIRSMEMKRLHGKDFVSIFSLMRDGRDLAERLNGVARTTDDSSRVQLLEKSVKPYVQFVKGEETCEHTGLRLVDIWRYFRHTWASPYKSVPGRHLMLLVRDAAARFHPVIGIASLSSATVGNQKRDSYLEWTSKKVVRYLREKGTAKHVQWMFDVVEGTLGSIYKADFFADSGDLLKPDDLRSPSEQVIGKLLDHSESMRQEHQRLAQSKDYEKNRSPSSRSTEDWEAQARTPLFQSKRARELTRLLKIKKTLQEHFRGKATKSQLSKFLDSSDGQDAVALMVRKIKADRVGTAIADLTICGAVPPYNELLGGKLVAMLAASPAVVAEYTRRYGSQPSIIASSMAGRAMKRSADLVFISTTSMYGQRPNQYDRVCIPCNVLEESCQGAIRYEYLGITRGIGTYHFSEETSQYLSLLLTQSKQGQRVHSIFGEGANPRLRKLRDGLDELGLPTDELLMHGTPRVAYGVSLIENLQMYLLGIETKPRYYLRRKKTQEASERIARWWMERWASKRVLRADVRDRIAQQTLVNPIRHRARVELPRVDSDQRLLFE